ARADAVLYAGMLVQMLFMSWLVWQLCASEQDRAIVMQAYVLGCLVSVASTISQFASGVTFGEGGADRFAAAGFNPNYLAATLAIGIPLAWHRVMTARGRLVMALNMLAIPAIIVAVVLTGSRGGFITTLLAVSVVPLTYARLRARAKVVTVVVLGLLT